MLYGNWLNRQTYDLTRVINNKNRQMIAIIGGGITGLMIAEQLRRAGVPYQLYETTDRVGGNIQSMHFGPYVLESGPNTLVMSDEIHQELDQLGLLDKVIYATGSARYRYILKNGSYRRLPSGPLDLLTNTTLSWSAKRHIWRETRIPYEEIRNESVDHFFRRRLGDEITDYLVYPFISGIYAGNPKQLLVGEAFPNLKEWEKTKGSILKGFVGQRKKKTHSGTFSFKGGLQILPDRLAEINQQHIFLNMPVKRLRRSTEWEVIFETGETKYFSEIVCTLPAHQLSRLVSDWEPDFASLLANIYYPPLSVVYSAYKKAKVGKNLPGFGALHNQVEESHTLGTLFSSTIFENRCPEDEMLFTTFVGGALHPQKAMMEESELLALVKADHRRFLRVLDPPIFSYVNRWPRAIPQYNEDVLPLKTWEDKLKAQQMWLGGNWIGGISVGACIKRSKILVSELITHYKALDSVEI